MILFFDTETSGLPLWRDPSDDPRQPHLLQIAAILCDVSGNEIESMSTLVKPGAGCVIEKEAFDAHGITLEKANAEGRDPASVVKQFIGLVEKATGLCGHNLPFDIRIMRIASSRHCGIKWENTLPVFDTMKRSTAIVNLPPTPKMLAAGFNKPKSPKLSECIMHFFGEELEGAHDALVDVRACMRIYFHLTNELGVAA